MVIIRGTLSLSLRAFLSGLGLCLYLCPSAFLYAGSLINYDVSMEGTDDHRLRALLEDVSETFSLRDKPPTSMHLLRRRIDQDIPRLNKVLRSQGFYRSGITSDIREVVRARPSESSPETAAMKGEMTSLHVAFHIEPGPRYTLKTVDIQSGKGESAPELALPGHEIHGLVPGDPAISQSILDGEGKIVGWFREQGFPFFKVLERKVVVDHKDQTLSVSFHIQTGPRATKPMRDRGAGFPGSIGTSWVIVSG